MGKPPWNTNGKDKLSTNDTTSSEAGGRGERDSHFGHQHDPGTPWLDTEITEPNAVPWSGEVSRRGWVSGSETR